MENKSFRTRINEVDYIWGDIHLGSEGMFRKAYRDKYKTLELHAEALVRNNNQLVTQESKVVLFLGDIGHKEYFKYISKMRGYKILIKGNHDTYHKDVYFEYFDEVFEGGVFIRPRILATHIPAPVEDGVINIHGHTHYIKLDSKNHFNLCPELHSYRPLPIGKVVKRMNNLKKPSYTFLEEWYADIQISPPREDLVIEEGRIDIEKSKVLIEELKKKRKKYHRRRKIINGK